MGFLDDLAQAWMNKERMRLGVPQEERAQEAHDLSVETSRRNLAMDEAEAPIRAAERQARTKKALADTAYQEGRNRTAVEIAEIRARAARELNPERKRLLEMQAAEREATAGLQEARTLNPAAFRTSGGHGGGGVYVPLPDAYGNVAGFYNNRNPDDFRPPTGLPPGTRRTQLPAGELEKRGNLLTLMNDVEELSRLAGGDGAGGIGPVAGGVADLRRTRIGSLVLGDNPPSVNDVFHIADNMADQLLRLRSGAQINEREFTRLRALVPDPRGGEGKFFDDLRRFQLELSNVLAARQGQQLDPSADPGIAAPARPATAPAAGGKRYRFNPATGKLE
jgi:hypothetical protein